MWQRLTAIVSGFAFATSCAAEDYLVQLERIKSVAAGDALPDVSSLEKMETLAPDALTKSTTAIEVLARVGQPFRVRVVDGRATWLFRGTITKVKDGKAAVSLESRHTIETGIKVKIDGEETLHPILDVYTAVTTAHIELGKRFKFGELVSSRTDERPGSDGVMVETNTRQFSELGLIVSKWESTVDAPQSKSKPD